MNRAALLLAALLACSPACGPTSEPAPRTPASTPAPPLHEGPLTDYVPAAGLRWLVVGRPKELASDPTLREAIGLLLPDERLAVFARSSGIDLRKVSNGLIAGFDHATLYAADDGSELVEERFSERLVAGARVTKTHPRVHRIAGVVGQTPETLVRVDGQLSAVSVGSGLPARIVELYAEKKLTKSPSALRGSALSTLPIAELASAPACFYAPGPFEGDWAQGAHGLLSAATAVGIAVRPASEGRVSVLLVIAGDFRSREVDPSAALGAAWSELAGSDLGKLLGLATASPPSISSTPDALRLTVDIEARPVALGLRAAVMAEVWEILHLDPPKPELTPRSTP